MLNLKYIVVQGFIVQTGDPTNTGKGGESIWGKTFSDEIKVRKGFLVVRTITFLPIISLTKFYLGGVPEPVHNTAGIRIKFLQ